MPRPGPRPYECVRRAWHSDRHHPIRGSLIQEIFRVANEVHSSATRKNREWQEKLPIVVLKAEEIMYSKANSEAEYSDLKTLWDRVNDAIDTIIRRDESTETGELLQPCIEAALNLGCTPRRSSRSQRNESPRQYLRPEPSVAPALPTTNPNTRVYGNHTTSSPHMLHCPQYSGNDTTKSFPFCLNAESRGIQNRSHSIVSKVNHPASARPAHGSLNAWSIYPLYCNNPVQHDDQRFYSSKSSSSYSHVLGSDKLGVQQMLPPSKVDASGFVFSADNEHTMELGHETNCDLTLRL